MKEVFFSRVLAAGSAGGLIALYGMIMWYPARRAALYGLLHQPAEGATELSSAPLMVEALVGMVLLGPAVLLLAVAARAQGNRIADACARQLARDRRGRFLILSALIVLMLAALAAQGLLGAIPHVQDEVALWFQAKNFASFQLAAPAPPDPEAFPIEFLLIHNGRWFGKYPPGYSALLALGLWAGVPWLVGPILAAATVFLVYLLGRAVAGPRIGLGAAALYTAAPWVWFMGSNYLSHTATAGWLAGFAWAVLRGGQRGGRMWFVAAGAALGMALSIRPYTALWVAIPFLIYLWTQVHRRDGRPVLRAILGLGVGLAPILAGLLLYNAALTGKPWLTPFQLYAPTDRPGFGPHVGLYQNQMGHTPWAGARHTAKNLLLLSEDLFGWPGLSLLFPLALFLFAEQRREPTNRLLGAAVALLILGYAFYHHSGTCFGPRYFYEATPFLCVLTARGIARAARAEPRGFVAALVVSAFVIGYATHLPRRAALYGHRYWGVDRAVRDAVDSRPLKLPALILVPGSELPAVFAANEPDLSGPRVYAQDPGPGRRAALAAKFPSRSVYLVTRPPGGLPQVTAGEPTPQARR